MNPPAMQLSTPTDTTIVITRTFNAPRRLVWEAMLTPDKMRRWMLPPPGLDHDHLRVHSPRGRRAPGGVEDCGCRSGDDAPGRLH